MPDTKRSCVIWFHLYYKYRKGKSVEPEIKLIVLWLVVGIRSDWNEYDKYFWDDRNVLKLDCGGVYSTLKVYLKLSYCALRFM